MEQASESMLEFSKLLNKCCFEDLMEELPEEEEVFTLRGAL